ncbi:METTL5 family protein [Halosegnis longus]|uniref:Methyltransferase domain-containing protein n=1 Tax=Halosegnis longus TaxID=2216012 RepID=A0AAJ4UW09_9EURY|nr:MULTISPECIES: METTL5 family protein [Halobacteriales]RNJ26450.1 methyltransferase domain-containing protein [Salella cibi]
MTERSQLAQQLGVVAGFDTPRIDLEQYRTPPELAAHLVHVAALQDDIADRTVVDLGCGTGMLTLASALAGARLSVGVELDAAALATASENESRVGARSEVAWLRGDATRPPLSCSDATVVMNPPFGARDGNEHADRAFLAAARTLGSVSYSIHNAGSREFVESFAADEGGEVTHAFAAEFDVPSQYDHHDAETRTLDTELFRIRWD